MLLIEDCTNLRLESAVVMCLIFLSLGGNVAFLSQVVHVLAACMPCMASVALLMSRGVAPVCCGVGVRTVCL